MEIGRYTIDKASPCYIIAEIGINHNGNINTAKELISIASNLGANAVKFQSFIPEDFYSSIACPEGITLLNKYKLSNEQHKELFDYCKVRKIDFISTPFEFESAKMLDKLGVPAFKIASGEINYYEFLKFVANFKKPMIISTGGSYLSDVEKARDAIYSTGNRDLAILHCVSAYPAPDEALNLNVIKTLKQNFPFDIIGFSDHSVGCEAAVIAVTYGAKIIEKHFTLDKKMEGPDHQASADPKELEQLITGVRRAEKMFGSGVKEKQSQELRYTRSLMFTRSIPKGEEIKDEDIIAARPPGGLDPEMKQIFIGRKTAKDVKKHELVSFDMI